MDILFPLLPITVTWEFTQTLTAYVTAIVPAGPRPGGFFRPVSHSHPAGVTELQNQMKWKAQKDPKEDPPLTSACGSFGGWSIYVGFPSEGVAEAKDFPFSGPQILHEGRLEIFGTFSF